MKTTRDPLLKLDDQFTHLVAAGETLILVGDEDSIVLEGLLAGDVVRLADGRRSANEIAAELGHVHRAELVHYVLLTLQRAGHIGAVNAGDGGDDGDAESLPPAVAALADRLRDAWSNRDGTNVAAIDLARKSGETLRLVLTDDYLHTELAEHCSSAPETPALLACLGSRKVWIGPGIESPRGTTRSE